MTSSDLNFFLPNYFARKFAKNETNDSRMAISRKYARIE